MKKVLVLGMLDSVHLARWLSQFEDQKIEFLIYPSKKFRTIHPDLLNLIRLNKHFKLAQKRFTVLYGYKEFAYEQYLAKIFRRVSTKYRLAAILKRNQFDYIHACEIQGAGYLLLSVSKLVDLNTSKLIITNWGSDIYYFKSFKTHNESIYDLLEIADYYSAECSRDYDLIAEYDYKGGFLPCIPNAGGIKMADILKNKLPSHKRDLILVKGYEGEFGRVSLILPAVKIALSKYINLKVHFYSTSLSIIADIKELQQNFPNRISFTSQKNPLSRDGMMELFLKSKIYIGASTSDGLSTSFLEAISFGAFPIQTNTSCADELLLKGALGSVVPLTSNSIVESLLHCLNDENLIEFARKNNKNFALNNFEYEKIKVTALSFYGNH
jgi:glycosyltransferase involved in cell wall biosynthesis